MAEAQNVTDFMDNIAELDAEIPDEVFVAGEFEVECVSMKFQISDEGEYPRFSVHFKILDNEEAELVYHTAWLPTKDDEKRQKNRRQRALRDMIRAFGYEWPMDLTELNDDNFKGRTVWATIGNKERDGQREHVIKGWVAPA